MFPAFDNDTKQLRKAAIAELEALEDIREQHRSRPLANESRDSLLAFENRHMRREMLARHALTSTARCYMDMPGVCEWRAKVREQIRISRSYDAQAQNIAVNNDADLEKLSRVASMEHYYRTHRVPQWLAGYRRAIAHARPEDLAA